MPTSHTDYPDVVGTDLAEVTQAVIDYVDTNEDYELAAGVALTKYYVLALEYGQDVAHTITLKSDSATIAEYELAGAAASKDSIAEGARCFTGVGGALKFRSTVAGTYTVIYTTSAALAYGKARI